MVDISFSDSVSGLLNEIKDSIKSDGILPLGLHLNYGLLDCDIIEEQANKSMRRKSGRTRLLLAKNFIIKITRQA